MSQAVLIAVDGSGIGERIVKYVSTYLDPEQMQCIVVCVAERPAPEYAGATSSREIEQAHLIEDAQATARPIADQLEQLGFSAVVKTPWDNPGPALIDAADAHDADMIVMGRRGRGEVRELLLGSVSQYVVHHAACPVVLLPARSSAE